MKKIIISIAAILISTVSLNAQIYKGLGVKIGINESDIMAIPSSMKYIGDDGHKYYTGFTAGIFREFNIYKEIKIVGYAGYTDKRRGMYIISDINSGAQVYEKYDLKFISLELTGKWIPGHNVFQVYVLGGLGLDIFLSAGKSYVETGNDYNFFLINRNKQLNAIVGGGIQFNVSPISLFFEAIYNPHLTDIGVDDNAESQMRTEINSFNFRTGIIF